MIRKLGMILLLMCFTSSLLFAAPEQDFTYWISIAFIIVTIHMFIVALAYMYANFFMAEDLKGWSKNEIVQAVYSLIILGSFVVLFTFISSIAGGYFAQIIDEGVTINTVSSSGEVLSSETSKLNSFCFNEGSNRWTDKENCDGLKISSDGKGSIVCEGKNADNCNPMFLMARSYLGMSFENLANLHKKLLRNYALMSAMNSMGFNLGIYNSPYISEYTFGGSISMNFMRDGVYINILESLTMFVEKILLMLKFQESVLKFMEYGLAFYLIVLGLIFRSIFIFRKFGGLLLSLGMCFMFVLPLLYILGWYTLSIPNIEVVLDEKFDAGTVSVADNWIFWMGIISTVLLITSRVLEFFSLDKVITAAIKSGIDAIVIIGQTVMFVEYGLYVNANTPDFYFTDYEKENGLYVSQKMGVLDYISRFLIIALAVPLLNIYIFFAFVRGLSPLLGGDAEIPALGRFL